MLEDKQTLEDCERFHCLPSALDGEDYFELQRLRSIETAEARYREMDRESRQRAAQRRRR